MTRFTPLALVLGALLASTSAHAANTVQISQIGEGELILVNQADQGNADATITQSGQRNRVQVDQTDTLHNPPADRNQAVIVQEGRNNAINNGLLLPAVRPGQNNTVAGGAKNLVDLRQGDFNNGLGYSQTGQGHDIHFVQGGNDNKAVVVQAGGFDGVNAIQTGEFNTLSIGQGGDFDRFAGDQAGSNNRMTLEQTGNLDFASFHQTGVGNTLVAFQSGPGSTAMVTQGGTGNFTQIVH